MQQAEDGGRFDDAMWLERLGPEGRSRLKQLRRWRRITAWLALVAGGGVFVISFLYPAFGDRLGLFHVSYLCVSMALMISAASVAIRHSRWIEKDVAGRLSLGRRGSWFIDLRSPEGFDESIRRLQAKVLKKDQKRTAPPWSTP